MTSEIFFVFFYWKFFSDFLCGGTKETLDDIFDVKLDMVMQIQK